MKKTITAGLLFTMFFAHLGFVHAETQANFQVNPIIDIANCDETACTQNASNIHDLGMEASLLAFTIEGEFLGATPIDFGFRTSLDGTTWSDWQYPSYDENSETKIYIEPIPLATNAKYVEYQYEITDEYSKISQVKIIPIDPGSIETPATTQASTISDKVDTINVISRQSWGADETYMTWLTDMTHAPVQQIVVHHTATPNDTKLSSDALVRSIYYYHAVEKEWGDIGYNYLIDTKGNIYEGRKGGINTVAAHAYGFNTGSVGISIMGDYTTAKPTPASLATLSKLIAYISYENNLDLNQEYLKNSQLYPAVVGHRDVGQTTCPGDFLYNQLPDVIAKAKTFDQTVPKKYSASLYNVYPTEINFSSEQDQTVNVKYYNNGNMAWLKSTQQIVLRPIDNLGMPSLFSSSSWTTSTTVGEADMFTIMPDQYGTFSLPIHNNLPIGTYSQKFALVSPDGIMTGSEFDLKVNILSDPSIAITNPSGIAPENYQASFTNTSLSVDVASGQKTFVMATLTNTGTNNWYNFGLFPLHLGTADEYDRASIFASGPNWITNNRILMPLTVVKAGESVAIPISIDATNVVPGTYSETLAPVIENLTWMNQAKISIAVNVH